MVFPENPGTQEVTSFGLPFKTLPCLLNRGKKKKKQDTPTHPHTPFPLSATIPSPIPSIQLARLTEAPVELDGAGRPRDTLRAGAGVQEGQHTAEFGPKWRSSLKKGRGRVPHFVA